MPRNNIITENFKNAIIDYSYLLEKDYPHKAILKIIGDRYLLTGLQRSILFRGITKKQTAQASIKTFLKPPFWTASACLSGDCLSMPSGKPSSGSGAPA